MKAGIDAWSVGDYARAIAEWRPLANAGNSEAQYNMGQAYRLGRGVQADPAIARSWFQKAGAQGHEQAQTALGLILFQSGDRTTAIYWLRKAADRGDPRGQYVLASAYYNGDGVTKDWARAYALMASAAAKGMPAAVAGLAQMEKVIPPAERERGVVLARGMAKATGASVGQRETKPAQVNGNPVAAARLRLDRRARLKNELGGSKRAKIPGFPAPRRLTADASPVPVPHASAPGEANAASSGSCKRGGAAPVSTAFRPARRPLASPARRL